MAGCGQQATGAALGCRGRFTSGARAEAATASCARQEDGAVAGGSAISIPPELGQAETAPGPSWALALVVVAADSTGRRLGVVASVAFREREEPGANLEGQQGACSGKDDVQGIETLLVSVQPLAEAQCQLS